MHALKNGAGNPKRDHVIFEQGSGVLIAAQKVSLLAIFGTAHGSDSTPYWTSIWYAAVRNKVTKIMETPTIANLFAFLKKPRNEKKTMAIHSHLCHRQSLQGRITFVYSVKSEKVIAAKEVTRNKSKILLRDESVIAISQEVQFCRHIFRARILCRTLFRSHRIHFGICCIGILATA